MSQASASWSPCEHWPQRKPTWLCGFPSFNGEQPGSNPLTDRVVQGHCGHWHFTSATLQAPCWTSILKIRSEPSNPRTKSPITDGLGPDHLWVFKDGADIEFFPPFFEWTGKQKRPGPLMSPGEMARWRITRLTTSKSPFQVTCLHFSQTCSTTIETPLDVSTRDEFLQELLAICSDAHFVL